MTKESFESSDEKYVAQLERDLSDTRRRLAEVEKERDALQRAVDLYAATDKLVTDGKLVQAHRALRNAADGMRDALKGCAKRLECVLCEMVGKEQPVFETPAPSALQNVKDIAAALAAYAALISEGEGKPTG